jgi:5-methyltetrahydrofolate--homocysteine methyltransferase
MIIEGGGWEVVDLGVDVAADTFSDAVRQHPGCVIGLSSLLTTTMVNMGPIIETIKAVDSSTMVLVGVAPVTADFAREVKADAYYPDPQGALEFLNKNCVPQE